jgi:mono/diheme cytochrome c family protein
MPFTHMSKEDVNAIISYLRAQKPVHNIVPTTNYTLMGKALTRFLLKPYKKTEEIPSSVTPGLTVEYGKYLSNSIANCKGCHTTFSMKKMTYDGPLLAGGGAMDEGGEYIFYPPNLTPHPTTGHIANWSEEQFVKRFKSGPAFKSSPMPWDAFGKMSDDDLKAIFMYLRSLDPVDNNPGPIVQLKEEI